MRTIAIIQARCGSTRFPEKVFAEISGHPLIWHVVNRVRHAKAIDEVVVATTINPLDDKLYDWCVSNCIPVNRGSENDVLNRFYETAKKYNADVVVRITADDPFKEPVLIDEAVNKLVVEGADYVCNNFPPTYPEGTDVEVLTFQALEQQEMNSQSDYEREHVTQYIYHNPDDFIMLNLSNDKDLSYLRWTIDTEKDFEMVKQIYDNLYSSDTEIFHMNDILSYLEKNPIIALINSDVKRSAMYNKQQVKWKESAI